MDLDTASRGIGTGIGIAAMGVGLGIAFDAMKGVGKKVKRSKPFSYKPPTFKKIKWKY